MLLFIYFVAVKVVCRLPFLTGTKHKNAVSESDRTLTNVYAVTYELQIVLNNVKTDNSIPLLTVNYIII